MHAMDRVLLAVHVLCAYLAAAAAAGHAEVVQRTVYAREAHGMHTVDVLLCCPQCGWLSPFGLASSKDTGAWGAVANAQGRG